MASSPITSWQIDGETDNLDWDLVKVGNTSVSKSEFCQEEGVPGEWGQACPHLPPRARLLLPHPVWKELTKSQFLAGISGNPSKRLVKFQGMEQTRTKTTIQESFKHDPATKRRCTAHTYMEKKKKNLQTIYLA